jgi:putative membrane protein
MMVDEREDDEMIRLYTLPLALLLTGTATVAAAQTPPPPPPPEAKTQAAAYVTAAGKSDMYEIESSRIALGKTQNAGIRRYADMMIKHHQKTTADTMAAARKAGMNPAPPAPDAGITASLGELRAATGSDFDRLYLGQQVPAHRAALDLHQSYAAGGDQPALKATGKKAVPIVKQHLAAAERMQRSAGGATSGM